jgi:soluble lytic murein transglycosylase-like protein
MMAMRGLLTLVRVLGVLALALAVYASMYPAHLGKWIGETSVDTGGAPAAAQPAALPAAAEVARPLQVSPSQAAMAQWLGNKYRVSPPAIGALIVEADKLSTAYRLSPNLIIAVMAIESNFHPYIQSEAGAQGLMQVMPVIHAKRYAKFGGKSSFIDPIVSLKVGAEILRDCARLKGGSETEALRFYFGGGAASDIYIDKVRSEQRRLNQVAAGLQVPID